VPAGPIVPGEEAPLIDLFREEARACAAALADGLQGPPEERAARVEQLAQAAHSLKGAALLVGLEPVTELARSMEDTLTAAGGGPFELSASAADALLEAAELLAGVVGLSAGDVPGWVAEHEAALDAVRQRLEALPRALVPAEAPREELARLPVGPVEVEVAGPPALPAPAEAARPEVEGAEAVVRVTAQSLNRLMGLAGESLVQARWLGPFATALMKLKKHQDHLAGLLDGLAQGDRGEDRTQRVDEARRQAALCRQVLAERIQEMEDHAAQVEGLNTRLYREVIVSRMRPFSDGAQGFPRLVRDMARRLGKQVRLDMVGQSTEVDRDILEKLEAPLTHLLRNAVDHGIESPEERVRAGKPEVGVVRLEAQHRAGMLALTVSDDGRGLDPERLRKKVVERGLATPEMARSLREGELFEFLFLPGFSTATEVSEYSGRGVGLDVVHTTVHRVGGSVRVTSRPGQGTAFDLRLPLTLSVLRAVLVQIAGEPYAFPHNRIDRLVRVPASAIRSLEHRQFVALDGQNVGLVLAAQLLELPGLPPGDELPVLLLSDSSGHYGLIVEAILGEQDLVVRQLDPRLGKVPNLSAAATLDSGLPVLIADVDDLLRSMDQFIQTGSLRRHARQEGVARRKRVLVVDDSITVREVERQLLRQKGYEVVVAVDGMDGWNAVREGGFDLVVTDVDMPRMNGLDLLRAIRDNEALRDVPIVIVSYKDREEERRQGLELGASYYLTKSSFHDNTFLQAVADLIGEP
jgi:two-component system sensor histidine kinase and response regulator WspE